MLRAVPASAHRFRRPLAAVLGIVASFSVLAACSTVPPTPTVAERFDPRDPLARCCTDQKPYPSGLIALVEPFAEPIGRATAEVMLRRGHLATAGAAQADFLARLQPLDIVLTAHRGRLSAGFIPGHVKHTTVYLGGPGDLGARAAAATAEGNRQRDLIRAGARFIESDKNGVHLSAPEAIFESDVLLAVRPKRTTEARRREVLAGLLAHIGTPFDFHFDLRTEDGLFCSELVNHLMPELKLPVRTFQKRPIVYPDSFAALAVKPGASLEFVAYLKADAPGAARFAGREELIADVLAAWPEVATAVVAAR